MNKAFYKRQEILFPFLLFLLNFVLKLIYINARDLAIDEPYTVFHAQEGWSQMIAAIKNDNTPPLFYSLLHEWIKIFGISLLSVRFLSVLFSSLTVIIIYKIGKDFFSNRVAILSSLIFTFSNLNFFYAHDARVYALFTFLSTLSFYFFLKCRYSSRKMFFIGLILSDILLCYSHFFGFLILGIQGIVVFLNKETRLRFIKKYFILLAAVLISYSWYLPVLFERFGASKNGTWVPHPLWNDPYTMLWRYSNVPVLTVFLLLILLIALVKNLKSINQISFALKSVIVFFLVPYLFLFVISFQMPVFSDRYLLFVSVFYYLSCGIAIDYLFPKNILWTSLTFIFPLIMIFTVKINPDKKRNISELVNYVSKEKRENSEIIIVPSWFDFNIIYYLHPGWFSHPQSYHDSLYKNQIIPVDNVTGMKNILVQNNSDIILIDGGHEATDPGNEIFNVLNKNLLLVDTKEFYQNLKVYHFHK